MTDTDGILDEALDRLHRAGPERRGWLSNHGPMAVEALVRGGHGPSVHRWLDYYRDKLEDMPSPYARVTGDNWREALGDPRRVADWTAYFTRELADHPWREVLAAWWPRLLPGIAGGATHPVIRVGHAVRTLLADPGDAAAGAAGPRTAELAHALGYWGARHLPLPPLGSMPGPAPASAAGALAAVPRVADQNGGVRDRLARIGALPQWPGARTAPGARGAPGPDEARDLLAELVRAAVRRYATHGHGDPIMLVHTATAPNAVLRTLPALPRELWAPSLDAAWRASAAITAGYSPEAALPVDRLPSIAPLLSAAPPAEASGTAGAPPGPAALFPEVFARAAAHGDEHAIKFTDTALDVAAAEAARAAAADSGTDAEGRTGPGPRGAADDTAAGGRDHRALAAALRACDLIDPAL
ncbi:questin oxidase family protein [Streptomyces sp. B1866]|uniref:questin oxidase family protein n=1 Tax=Streptomyces sp. B1866 TaxID=3075431 RepID=UPI00288D5AD7|nr:questin oxidase family protein [Streptomyces sp. B1866]MDT3398507.1 questin oxidase family protein [Streptomyces sp. B1866]